MSNDEERDPEKWYGEDLPPSRRNLDPAGEWYPIGSSSEDALKAVETTAPVLRRVMAERLRSQRPPGLEDRQRIKLVTSSDDPGTVVLPEGTLPSKPGQYRSGSTTVTVYPNARDVCLRIAQLPTGSYIVYCTDCAEVWTLDNVMEAISHTEDR